jgi:hypothetical protein
VGGIRGFSFQKHLLFILLSRMLRKIALCEAMVEKENQELKMGVTSSFS